MTTPNQLAAWAAGPNEQERLRADNDRLTDLVMRLAERIYLAHEVLAKLAERKAVRVEMGAKQPPRDRTRVATVPDGRIQLRGPDGVVVRITTSMALDLLSNEATRLDLRRAIWQDLRLRAVIEDQEGTA